MTLPELLQEHFDGVLNTIEAGRWGPWVLAQDGLARGELVLVHETNGARVAVTGTSDWAGSLADAGWATAGDIGNLVFAIRDLEYARWLGVLPRDAAPTHVRTEHAASR